MNSAEWCRACRQVAEAQSRVHPTARNLRDGLAELDRVVLAAPWDVRNSYAEIPEAELNAEARMHASSLEAGTMAWPCKAVGARRAMRAVAVQIRAIDALLANVDSRNARPPSRSGREWLTSDGRAYVVPSRRPRDMGSARGDNLRYARRGTLLHRIVPTEAGGMPVRLVPGGTLRPEAPAEPLRLGAGLFPAATLSVSDGRNGGFLAVRLEGSDQTVAVPEQIAGLDGSEILLWPELTMDDGTVELVQRSLARNALTRGTTVQLAVPGSWHRPSRDGVLRNVAPVLDGTGGWLGEYAKVAKFKHDEHGWEAISTGRELLVIACDGFLASIAICKDFCDLADAPPWPQLPIDVLLVPSMGNATTMSGHLHRARENRVHGGVRVFVVQHGMPKSAQDAQGFVLFGLRDPPEAAAATRTDARWAMADVTWNATHPPMET